jgi:hypothetical protein
MVYAGELHILGPSDVAGHVSAVLHVDREIAGAMQY